MQKEPNCKHTYTQREKKNFYLIFSSRWLEVCARGRIWMYTHRCTRTCIEIGKLKQQNTCFRTFDEKTRDRKIERKRVQQCWCLVPSKANVIKSAREFSGFNLHLVGKHENELCVWVPTKMQQNIRTHRMITLEQHFEHTIHWASMGWKLRVGELAWTYQISSCLALIFFFHIWHWVSLTPYISLLSFYIISIWLVF